MQRAQPDNIKIRARTFLTNAEQHRPSSRRSIQASARALFSEYRRKLLVTGDSGFPLPVRTELIIREVLKVNYVEYESIPTEPLEEFTTGKSMTEIAGLMDRKNSRIVIASKFPSEWKRFTAAHEIAHWRLHKDLVYLRERPAEHAFNTRKSTKHNALQLDLWLRERPITGHELDYTKRPLTEREADWFAAELLMPSDLVVENFFYRFGSPIDGTKVSNDAAFWLSLGRKHAFDADEFAKWPRRRRSSHIAQMTSFNGEPFIALAKLFGVSTTPMAIQLEDLGLVT